jgi:sugar O-acyltransferase (sialic acid O-acetyltransferase NeuD family)
MIKSEILIPLLNANEPEARLVGIHAKDGQAIEKGVLLFTIETTKATADIISPEKGYLYILAKEGDILSVGERLAVITEKIGEKIQVNESLTQKNLPPSKFRITKPARTLAESLGINIAELPGSDLITEQVIRQIAGEKANLNIELNLAGKPNILIYGSGGHAKAIIDMVRQIGKYEIAGLIDDNIQSGTMVMGIPVLGTQGILPTLFLKGVKLAANGVGGILDIAVRVKIFDLLTKAGYHMPELIHPRATLEPSAKVENGVQVFANAYIGSEAFLHSMSMINTNAVISHDCEIGSYSHIAPGALLAGHVSVGERTLIGMGVTTTIGIKIGCGVRIGNGATVLADVPDKTIIQAGRYWVGKAETL